MFTCHHKLSKSETAEFLKYWESIMIDLGLPIDQKSNIFWWYETKSFFNTGFST